MSRKIVVFVFKSQSYARCASLFFSLLLLFICLCNMSYLSFAEMHTSLRLNWYEHFLPFLFQFYITVFSFIYRANVFREICIQFARMVWQTDQIWHNRVFVLFVHQRNPNNEQNWFVWPIFMPVHTERNGRPPLAKTIK